MRKIIIVSLAAVLLFASGIILEGCSKQVSEVKEDKITAVTAKKKAEEEARRRRRAARIEEEKVALAPEAIRESILESEEEVPPQESARGKEFSPAGSIIKTVYFEFDKAALTTETKQLLKENAEWLKANPSAEVLIEGHSDERGTEEYNLALGERRAMGVRKFLIRLGIDPVRLYTISYGEEKPLDTEHTEDAWSKNRRAEFQVTSF